MTVNDISAATGASLTCHNCGTVFQGNYCPSCGQKAGPPMPSTKEIAGDFLRSAFTPSGKVWESLWHLISKPGELTRVYLAGQRRRYVHPVRMYLICVFMLVACGAINNKLREWNGSPRFEVALGQSVAPKSATSATEKTGDESSAAREAGKKVGRAMKETLPPWMSDWIKKRSERNKDLNAKQVSERAQRAMSENQSLLFALLVPAMALINWPLYAGRGVSYAGHVVFMLHMTAGTSLIVLGAYVINSPIAYWILSLAALIWASIVGRRAFGVSYFGSIWRYIVMLIPALALSALVGMLLAVFAVLLG